MDTCTSVAFGAHAARVHENRETRRPWQCTHAAAALSLTLAMAARRDVPTGKLLAMLRMASPRDRGRDIGAKKRARKKNEVARNKFSSIGSHPQCPITVSTSTTRSAFEHLHLCRRNPAPHTRGALQLSKFAQRKKVQHLQQYVGGQLEAQTRHGSTRGLFFSFLSRQKVRFGGSHFFRLWL